MCTLIGWCPSRNCFFCCCCIPHLTELLINQHTKILYSFLDFQKHITGIIFYCPLVILFLLLLAKCVLCILYMCLVFYFISQSLDPFPAAGVLKATIIYANFFHFSFFCVCFKHQHQHTKALTQALKLIHNIMFSYIYIFSFCYLASPLILKVPWNHLWNVGFPKKKNWKKENEKSRKLYVFSFHLWYFVFVQGKLKIMASLGITLRVLFFQCCCFFFCVLKLRKFFLPHYFRFTHLARD